MLILVLCIGAATAAETPANTNNATMNSIDDTPIGVSENTGGAEPLLGASNNQNDILKQGNTYLLSYRFDCEK